MDQGIHLLETKSMVDNRKILLLGPNTSISLDGRLFFTGANYYYVLAIIGVLGHWQPLIITGIFIIIEFIFYLFFILLLKKIFTATFAITAFLFISLSPYLVIHSRFFWNPHLLIPLSILTLYFLLQFLHQKHYRYLFYAAFFWGFAFACHYSAILWAVIFLFVLIKSHHIHNIKSYLLIGLGLILGNLPLILFEVRHSFYNLKTIIYIFTHSPRAGDFTSHYVVFPFLIFSLYFILYLYRKYQLANFLLIILFSLLTIIQLKIFNYYQPLDVIPGWDYSTQNHVADLIAQNCPANFNIAATIQGDTRFYDLRYLLDIKNCYSEGVEDYPTSQKLFLVAPVNRPPETETVWEVSSFKPFIIKQKISLNDHLYFYELEKSVK